MTSVTLYGNGYAEIVRDNSGKAVRINKLEPEVPQPSLSKDGELFIPLTEEWFIQMI
jgi:phage portal protein BeeE